MITDMMRIMSMFDLNVDILREVENGIANEGSNLSGVSCECIWSDRFIPRMFSDVSFTFLM